MESTSIFVESKEDANANSICNEQHEGKFLVDFENMLEKADSSLEKLYDFGGTDISEDPGMFGHQFQVGDNKIKENRKVNYSSGEISTIGCEDIKNLLDNHKKNIYTTEEEPAQNTNVKDISQLNDEIRVEKKVSTGFGSDKDSSPGIQEGIFVAQMDSGMLQDEIRRSMPWTTESKVPSKAQTGQDQLLISKPGPVNGLHKNRAALGKNSTSGSQAVVPINSATLYEELRRAIKEGNWLKKNNQQYELRNMELQGEVLEVSRMAAHYEAKSERSSTREDELRNELNAAIKRATQSQKEAKMCKKKVGLLEGLFVDSEKRQSVVKKRLEEAENKIKTLEEQNKELKAGFNESAVMPDDLKEAVAQTEATNEVEPNTQEQKDCDLKEDEAVKPHIHDHNHYTEYEDKEYRYFMSALKQQLQESHAINKRYCAQVKHQVMTMERLKLENAKLQSDIRDMKMNDKGRKGKAFLYLQQYRESQVQMQSVQSELKMERAEKDDLKIQCKWMKIEIDRLKSALTSKASKETQRELMESQGQLKGGDAKIIEDATNLVEERMKFARSMSKDSKSYGTLFQKSEEGKLPGDGKNSKNPLGNTNQYEILKDQHEKLSIEMALTRNTVKKLESDNGELRQQISLLKAEIALGIEGVQKEDSGGVIPGKYRRGNFEVVSKPINGQRKSRRTQSMSGFRAITVRQSNGNLEPYDKAQSLIDLTKVSIDEIDERRSSLKKHNSEGERICEYSEDREASDNDDSRLTQSLKAVRVENPDEILFNEIVTESKSKKSSNNLKGTSLMRSVRENHTHSPLSSTNSFPHTDEISNFGNFKKTESASRHFHAFKVPGALRASPAAKSFNSFVYPPQESTRESDHDSKQKFNEHEYNYVAI